MMVMAFTWILVLASLLALLGAVAALGGADSANRSSAIGVADIPGGVNPMWQAHYYLATTRVRELAAQADQRRRWALGRQRERSALPWSIEPPTGSGPALRGWSPP